MQKITNDTIASIPSIIYGEKFNKKIQKIKEIDNEKIKKKYNMIDLFIKGYHIYLLSSCDISFLSVPLISQETNYNRFSSASSFSINSSSNISGRSSIHSRKNRTNSTNTLLSYGGSKNKKILLKNLIDNYLKKKIVFTQKRPILSFTQTQKNKIREYNNKITKFKRDYANNIYSFFLSLKNCGNNEMSLCTLEDNDIKIL